MKHSSQSAISHLATASLIALIVIIGSGSVYLSINTISSTRSSTALTGANSCTTSSSGVSECRSCSPSTCGPPQVAQQMTTINGSTYVIINGTATESIACVIPVPAPQGILLEIVNDSGTPISQLRVAEKGTAYQNCAPISMNETLAVTNSSGWALFAGHLVGTFFSVNYSGLMYNFTVPATPMAWTIAKLTLPSGMLFAQVCGLGGGAINSSCQAPSTATILHTPNEFAGALQSDINASNPCGAFFSYGARNSNDSSFESLISNVESSPEFQELEGNRSSYNYSGGGCGTPGLSLVFSYEDLLHPFKSPCGSGDAFPSYQIYVRVLLTNDGYDLGHSNYTALYNGPTNSTFACTTSISMSG